jgi:hypothetical protein
MAIITDYMKERLVKHLLGIENLHPLVDLKLALYTSADGIQTDTPTGELTDPNYERKEVVFNELMVSNPFHFNGFTTELIITHQALVGTVEGVDRIVMAIPFEPPITPLIVV